MLLFIERLLHTSCRAFSADFTHNWPNGLGTEYKNGHCLSSDLKGVKWWRFSEETAPDFPEIMLGTPKTYRVSPPHVSGCLPFS